jgi:hypothetical protein
MSSEDTLWHIARLHRDRTWETMRHKFDTWEPTNDVPEGDVEQFWYLQGKVEAYAAIMSECESVGH